MSANLFSLADYADVINWTESNYTAEPEERITGGTLNELNLTYAIFELLVAIVAVIGNAMVIIVFKRERRLRRRTNYYIVSLAMADFLVGLLGIPFAILASVGLPRNLHACLFTISLLVVCCTISIFCLVAVSVDRYWAILHPMAYSRNVRTKTAIGKRRRGKHFIMSLLAPNGIFLGQTIIISSNEPKAGEIHLCKVRLIFKVWVIKECQRRAINDIKSPSSR